MCNLFLKVKDDYQMYFFTCVFPHVRESFPLNPKLLTEQNYNVVHNFVIINMVYQANLVKANTFSKK